jgi:2-polyprenyl-3-methyl-5-hydroxy-6-metoxy-1,4-benzoquinol methylase
MSGVSPKELREFYEKGYERGLGIAQIPDANDFMYSLILRNLIPYLRPKLKALDLGCHTGGLTLYMARAGCEAVGIDIALNAIETARKSASFHGIANVRFECLDFIRQWDTPNLFDLVLCCNVIEHIPQDQAFLEKIAYSLKKGGRLLLIAPTIYSSHFRITKRIWGKCVHDEQVGHLRRYAKDQLIEMSEKVGFHVDKSIFLDGPLREWFIVCKPLRVFNIIWYRPIIRVLFNALDSILATRLFPGALCIHARLR